MKSRPFLVPLFPEQMELLRSCLAESKERALQYDAWLFSRTEHALLAGLALAERYSTPEEPPL